MSARLREVLLAGFHADNLVLAKNECEGNIGAAPALYGPLFFLFCTLLEQMDAQGIPTKRMESFTLALQGPILALLDSGDDSELFQVRLGEVMRNAIAVL